MLENLDDGPHTILFDPKVMKPGCPLLQAAAGNPRIASCFDTEVWLLAPTPDMRVYEVTKAQLTRLVAIVHEKHLKK